jgi:hypothetical protein
MDLPQWADLESFVRGRDNAVYDLSIHGAQELDYLEDHPATYYFSFLTDKTRPEAGTGNYVPDNGMNPAFRYVSTELGRSAQIEISN